MAFTTVQYIRHFQAALATATTTQYTTPAARQDVLKDIEICNTTGASISVSVYVVPTGNSAAPANALYISLVVGALTTYHWTGTIVMNAGDFIATSTTATGLTMTVSGLESQ